MLTGGGRQALGSRAVINAWRRDVCGSGAMRLGKVATANRGQRAPVRADGLPPGKKTARVTLPLPAGPITSCAYFPMKSAVNSVCARSWPLGLLLQCAPTVAFGQAQLAQLSCVLAAVCCYIVPEVCAGETE